MLILLSPSKTMRVAHTSGGTTPIFIEASEVVHRALKARLQKQSIVDFYRCSPQKADAISALWQSFDQASPGPAIESYDGLVFKTLDWNTLTPEAQAFGRAHLCFLSGFYGLLRPLDAIRPHRLDWSDPLSIDKCSLAQFWAETITPHLAEAPRLINLASKEYSAPWAKHLACETFHFKEREKNGQLRAKSTSSKQARGAMARAICESRAEHLKDLFSFSPCGFHYDHSNGQEHIFILDKTAP